MMPELLLKLLLWKTKHLANQNRALNSKVDLHDHTTVTFSSCAVLCL